MTELGKIAYARTFMDKLANGINPLDDTPVPENDIVNNVRLSRCFFYVSDILRQVYENEGIKPSSRSRQKKKDFALTEEEYGRLTASEIPISVSEIAKYLNSLVDLESTKKITAAAINKWLIKLGFLDQVELPNGKERKLPTPQGNEIGITAEERSGMYGSYTVVLYNSQAQQFVYDNIDAIVAFKNEGE